MLRDALLDDDDDADADARASTRVSRAGAAATVARLGAPLMFQYVSTSVSTAFQLSLVSRVAGARALGRVRARRRRDVGDGPRRGLGARVGRGHDRRAGERAGAGSTSSASAFVASGSRCCGRSRGRRGARRGGGAGRFCASRGVDAGTAERRWSGSRGWRVPGLFLQCATCATLKTMLAMKRSSSGGGAERVHDAVEVYRAVVRRFGGSEISRARRSG